jgi:tetratricopeptide (TPR) repeat protein
MCAVMLGLAVFPMFEVTCRIAGWGERSPVQDPFVGFSNIRPLFRLNPEDNRFHIAEDRRLFFAEDSFTSVKGDNEFRIFVFGGSTVQGRPYSIQTSFGSFLKIALQTLSPETDYQVVNCGGISYASYRLLPIIEECRNYQPDLFIVCTGHNEFLEDVTYRDIRNSSDDLPHVYNWLNRLNSFRLLSSAIKPQAPQPSQLPSAVLAEEVDALLDHQGGLEAYSRQSLHREAVVRQFETNLKQMHHLSQQAGVPFIFVLPPSNLKDCPPFKSEFSEGTDSETRSRVAALLKQAASDLSGNPEQAVSTLKQATQLDTQFAFAWYQLGHALLATGEIAEAEAAFQTARDEDVCPLRMVSKLEDVMEQVASQSATPLTKVQPLLKPYTGQGIMDDSVLADHIHPTFRSNQRIALALMELMHQMQLAPESGQGHESRLDQQFSDHLQSLDNMYFLRGRRTLKSLQEWTQGRADGPPLIRRQAE